jgi:eukaryotic-like serine/threonine-protein kinase
MALAPDARLGPYEIVSMLGAGGMGEVYEARDTRLQRTVALKVLTIGPGQGNAAARLERFRREAHAVSRLSHPHICALFDVGEQDGHAFLVMEHLEGETLAARLAQGPLPLERALRYGVEMASALDAAHRHGIVHRDLKPANVMLTRHGLKLLDFGLARLRAEPGEVLTASDTGDLTDTGAVLGTVPYMAPEHLDGREADARADVFALGVVLYEMVCGRRPFEADGKGRLMAAILEHEPSPASHHQPLVPPVLDHVLKRCLAKDPEERWQSARDVAIALEGAAAGSPPAPASRVPRRAAALAGILGVALAGVAAWSLLRPSPAPRRSPLQLQLALDRPPMFELAQRSLALSPHGARLAYVTGSVEHHRLALRELGQSQSILIAGTDGAGSPFFSPDDRWLAFFADGFLTKVALAGGEPVTLCEAARVGGVWGPDGAIVLVGGPGQGLLRVPAGGGRPQPLTRLDAGKGESAHANPHFLPGGRALLYTVITDPEATYTTVVQDLDSGERREVGTGYDTRYLPSGHVIFNRRRSRWKELDLGLLVASRFDLSRRALDGREAVMVQDLDAHRYHPIATSDVSANGSLVYLPAPPPGRLVWVDRRGKPTEAIASRAPYEEVHLSARGLRAVVGMRLDIWRLDFGSGTLSRFALGAGESAHPALSPDESRVAYSCRRWPRHGVCVRAADGSGAEEVLLEQREHVRVAGWTPDGRMLVLLVAASESNTDVWTLLLDGGSRPRPLLASAFGEQSPTVSPDGRWIAYSSDESTRREVYVQAFPELGRRWQVSTGGGDEPVWNPAGNELFYRHGDDMMAVPVKTGSSLQAGVARVLFSGRYLSRPQRPETHYAVTPDGQRFLMIDRPDSGETRTLTMIVDWAEELARRLP